ncbi:hypothetical protein [Kitasatospora sp. NPDC056531]|uniref:hypothetical protein n=1 Tax=Kitasatospora sp. NPDC056531 TaxID=3345856 RepID=UPI0036C2ED0F
MKGSRPKDAFDPAPSEVLASREHGLAGRNWATCYTYEWISRPGVYRLTGNVHRATAHASR